MLKHRAIFNPFWSICFQSCIIILLNWMRSIDECGNFNMKQKWSLFSVFIYFFGFTANNPYVYISLKRKHIENVIPLSFTYFQSCFINSDDLDGFIHSHLTVRKSHILSLQTTFEFEVRNVKYGLAPAPFLRLHLRALWGSLRLCDPAIYCITCFFTPFFLLRKPEIPLVSAKQKIWLERPHSVSFGV